MPTNLNHVVVVASEQLLSTIRALWVWGVVVGGSGTSTSETVRVRMSVSGGKAIACRVCGVELLKKHLVKLKIKVEQKHLQVMKYDHKRKVHREKKVRYACREKRRMEHCEK